MVTCICFGQYRFNCKQLNSLVLLNKGNKAVTEINFTLVWINSELLFVLFSIENVLFLELYYFHKQVFASYVYYTNYVSK